MKPYKNEINQNEEPQEIKPFKELSAEELDVSMDYLEEGEVKQKNYTKSIGIFGSLSGVFVGIFAFIFLMVFAKTVGSVTEVINNGSISEYIYLGAFAFLFLVLGLFTYENVKEYFKIKEVDEIKQICKNQKAKPDKDIILVAHKLINLHKDSDDEELRAKCESFKESLNSSVIYENVYESLEGIISHVDKKAKKVIHKASIQGALSTAISPVPIIDMAIMVYRSVLLAREVASLYGLRPGVVTTTMLLKQGLINVAFVGVSEMANEFANQVASTSFLARASRSLGQGAVNGILLARLGYGILEACRPIESSEGKTSFFKMLLQSLKGAFGVSKE